MAVFAHDGGENKVVRIGEHVVELVHFDRQPKNHVVDLSGMSVIRDTNKFFLSSAVQDITPEKYQKALNAAGKKSLISSLMLQQKMNSAVDHPTLAAMWAKLAAYQFIAGTLALAGKRPMPLHELDQVRQAEAPAGMADGLQAALECIGTERATRPAISRSIEAVRELKSKDYDDALVMSKINYLLGRQMLADCYYYIGRTAAENLLAKRNDSFYTHYAKLIQLSMDLTSDVQHLQKLQRRLFRAANTSLKG